MTLGNPFSSDHDLNLESWLVRSKVAKLQINSYFAKGLSGTDNRLSRSAYTMQQHFDLLDPFGEYLVWMKGVIDDGRHASTLYYQNIINCVRYVIRQVAYGSDMAYAPIREYDSSREQLYSAMPRVDWWWDTQV